MPIRRKTSLFESIAAETLKQRLTQEFKNPQEKEPEPLIVEEQSPTGGLRLYVVWKAWEEFGQRERSEIISEAYRAAHGAAKVISRPLVLAIGLTPQEAKTMNLTYA
jgi:hypothetical protein